MKGKIAAGIVLFNPENEARVRKSIDSIITQVDVIYVFDNSTNIHGFTYLNNVVYISEKKNRGIAYALNILMETAKKDGYEWLVTMDQDSISPEGMIDKYEKYINDEQLGIVCPQVIDARRSYMEVKKEPKEEYIDFCITSASCTRISAWERIGKFDEWLFIDLVDNDFCKRMTLSGYKILRLNELVIDQEFGKIVPKSERKQDFWNRIAKCFRNDNFGKFGYIKYVNPTRVYYTNRNIIYVNRKLKKYGKTGYKENYNCNGYFGFLISFVIPSIFRAQEKMKVVKAVITGIRDGQRADPNIWVVGK